MAEVSDTGPLPATDNADLQLSAQAMINQLQPDFGFEEGEVTMFIMDTPDLPQQRPQVMLVQAAQTQQTKAQYDRVVGICETAEAGGGGVSPVSALQNYFSILEKKVVIGSSTVTVLEMPKHGELYDRGTMINRNGKLVDSGERSYYFTAKPGYFGEDRVVFMVEMGGMKVKVVYSLHVTEISDDEVEGNHCPVPYQKLENSTGGATSSQSFLFNFAQQGGVFSGLSGSAITFADLPGAALGQTNVNGITLDTNASGYGWFIDTTPADNSEFLPTSNPYEWVAKAGSSAEGKMDMLSVLLHEYGHALGIEHSADSHNYMATTLTAGVHQR